MKQLFVALLLTLFVAPSAFAHTQLSSTSPAHEDIVTTPLTEISLTYAGRIEEGSNFELTNTNGEAIEIVALTILDGVMSGAVAEPLANGKYTVKWDSISEDGHPLSGTFSFTVKVTDAVEETEAEVANEAVVAEQVETEEVPTEESSNTGILIVVGILAVLIVTSIIVLVTRRKG